MPEDFSYLRKYSPVDTALDPTASKAVDTIANKLGLLILYSCAEFERSADEVHDVVKGMAQYAQYVEEGTVTPRVGDVSSTNSQYTSAFLTMKAHQQVLENLIFLWRALVGPFSWNGHKPRHFPEEV